MVWVRIQAGSPGACRMRPSLCQRTLAHDHSDGEGFPSVIPTPSAALRVNSASLPLPPVIPSEGACDRVEGSHLSALGSERSFHCARTLAQLALSPFAALRVNSAEGVGMTVWLNMPHLDRGGL